MGGESEDDEDPPLVQAASGAVMALTFLVGFGLMFAGVPWFWVAFPVGFAGLLPAAIGLARWYERSWSVAEPTTSPEERALEELRERYARGDLTDEEFERRVERLLETESIDDAETFLGGGAPADAEESATERSGSREPEVE